MAQVHYQNLDEYLEALKSGRKKKGDVPVYLLYGEESLYKGVLEKLLDALLPAEHRHLYYEPVDGAQENMHEIIEKVNTYSLLSDVKIVAVVDSRIFYSKKDARTLLGKAKERYEADQIKAAAAYLRELLGVLNLDLEDIAPDEPAQSLKLDLDEPADAAWLKKLVAYCKENRLSVPESRDQAGLLKQAIEKGFPEGNCLIIATEMVDKRRDLYQTIQKVGTVIDCSVPLGDRLADRRAQEALLSEQLHAALSESGKTIDRPAREALIDLTGFDLRTFAHNVEKLVNYVGSRKTIHIEDVEAVLERTRKDPIYAMTNAVADKNPEMALFFLDSLLADNMHPLQILAAGVNQIRKLVIAKDFAESPYGRVWHSGLSFDRFKHAVMPAVKAYDDDAKALLTGWVSESDSQKGKKAPGGRGHKSDLLITGNSKSPYPLYLTLQKADNFSRDELTAALKFLYEADICLKTTGQTPRLVLEKAIISICRENSA